MGLPPNHVPYSPPSVPDAAAGAQEFHDFMDLRRSARIYSDAPVTQETIEWIVRAASTAPSGANKQPWRFVCVSDPATKRKIRLAAEEEEREFYASRAGEGWLKDLEPFGTDADKDFLEIAPWLIVVFRMTKTEDGGQVYYGQESVGIACGMLLAAIHHAGLVALTHTPSPMGFLSELLERPRTEKPYLLIPVGHAAADCVVPDIGRKSLEEIALFR